MYEFELPSKTIENADEPNLLDIQRQAAAAAERAVVELVREVDGRLVNFDYYVDTYNKQRLKMQSIVGWLKLGSYGNNSFITDRNFMIFYEGGLIEQLARADYDDEQVREKARCLYKKYTLFCSMLDDEIERVIKVRKADGQVSSYYRRKEVDDALN